jgi:hypothetical protein
VTCAEVREHLSEHALGLLGSEDVREVERHLQWCAGCRKESAELLEGVASLALSIPPVDPPLTLEDEVVDRVGAASGTHRRRGRRGFRVLAAMALAAAVFAGSAVGWGVRQRNQAELARSRLVEIQQQSADTRDLILQLQKQFNGVAAQGKLYQADLFPVSRRELGGTALMFVSAGGQDFILVDVVAPLDARSAPFSANLVSSTGRRLEVGTLARTNNGDYVLFRLDLPKDLTRPDAVELSQVTALEIIDRLGLPLASGTVHRYIETPASP